MSGNHLEREGSSDMLTAERHIDSIFLLGLVTSSPSDLDIASTHWLASTGSNSRPAALKSSRISCHRFSEGFATWATAGVKSELRAISRLDFRC
jgi:hypothetical protein